MKKERTGFGVVVELMLLVLVGLIGFVAWYVWHSKNSATTTYNNAGTASSVKSSSSNQKTVSDTAAASLVLDFYKQYTGSSVGGYAAKEKALIQQYGTTNLLNYFKNNQNGVDPVVCAQMAPTSINIASHTVSGNAAEVVVGELFGTDPMSVTAKVINQGGLKIDALICPKPLPASGNGGP